MTTPDQASATRSRWSIVGLGMAAVLTAMTLATPARAEMLAAGASMPEFALSDQNGNVVRSADLAGKSYFLWFYPKAQTPGCTVEAQGLRDRHAALDAAGVVVLGISFDDPEANKRFVEAEALPFRLLSDKDRKLSVALGAADSEKAWFARRISYLVGPDGKVRKAYEDVDPSTHADEVVKDCSTASSGAK
jgi:peroxiredoxin Q/BCP